MGVFMNVDVETDKQLGGGRGDIFKDDSNLGGVREGDVGDEGEGMGGRWVGQGVTVWAILTDLS
jgi:hypothetical protein